MTLLAPLLQEFFTTHLTLHRAASPATMRAYRDTWRLFLSYMTMTMGTQPYLLTIEDINESRVLAFLDYLEHERGNSISTRNLRLAAIKTAVAFSSHRLPEHLHTIARVQAIPTKKKPRYEVAYLTEEELQALLDAITTSNWIGRRDKAMFTLAAQTGLRVSELASLTISSLHLTPGAAYVSCTGKGRKNRTTPLTTATTFLLRTYITERGARSGQALFPNPDGNALSTDAISKRLAVHLQQASNTFPALTAKQVTVHTLRHTAAMRFLHAGVDCAVIALWLGHESPATTNIYLHADQSLKRAALARTRQPEVELATFQPRDPLLAWLEAL